MDEKRYRLADTALSLPRDAADRLLSLRDGDCALLYIYLLRTGGEFSPAQVSSALSMPENRVLAAGEKLRRQGLLAEQGQKFIPGPEELPQYDTGDILRKSREDGSFQALIAETQRVMGHALSGADLNTLFGIYDRLGMSTGTILYLINHCADKLRRRYGEGRLPTMRSIEKEAFVWANREIVTEAQAEEYIASLARREQESEKLRAVLQISGREPTRTEREYMDRWLAMGFSAETLALAYDRTVTGTGRLAWAYMNKIVQSWYEKGLFTRDAIEKGDSRVKPQSRPQQKSAAPTYTGQDDLGSLESFLK